MSTLYVTEPGARLEREMRRILVVKEDQALLAVPLAQITQVVLVGNVGATTPALHALLEENIGVLLLNRWGRTLGRLTPAIGGNLALRQQQYTCSGQPEFCLRLATTIATGKLCNYRALARRLVRSHPQLDPGPIATIERAIQQLKLAPELASVRGLEGTGTRAYFAVLRQVLHPEMGFPARVRRPPSDPVNAILSLGYTLLAQNCLTACEVVGLDPYRGFYHSDVYGRPALALDLMEEFRSLIVDSVMLNLVNRRMLKAKHFEPGPQGALFLKPNGMRTFFRRYTARLQSEVTHPLVGRKLTYQKVLEVQARMLRKVIEGQSDRYIPFATK